MGGGDDPPSFDGDRSNWGEWKRRAELWLVGSKTEEPKQGAGLQQALKGNAWAMRESLKVEDVRKPDGAQLIISKLEEAIGDETDVQVFEASEEVLYKRLVAIGQVPHQLASLLNLFESRLRRLTSVVYIDSRSEANGVYIDAALGHQAL